MTAYDRSKAWDYADSFWKHPCHDNWIVTKSKTVFVEKEFKKRLPKEDRGEWEAQFVEPPGGRDPDTREKVPEIACFVSHKDNSRKVKFLGWKGTNDCAHFVSRCVGTEGGGLQNVNAAGVTHLREQLLKQPIAKLLGLRTSKEKAKRIIEKGLLKRGDVIMYYEKDKTLPGHCALYLGSSQIACHTKSRWEADWTLNTEAFWFDLIHFAVDDRSTPSLGRTLSGWWVVTRRSENLYYFFRADGRVAYTKVKPANWSVPISAPTEQGFWFGRDPSHYSIVWSRTGSFEDFTVLNSGEQAGKVNEWERRTARRP